MSAMKVRVVEYGDAAGGGDEAGRTAAAGARARAPRTRFGPPAPPPAAPTAGRAAPRRAGR
ncbi:hypothetical protein AB0N81_12515 [Streptomyces sp. NPDC093510]|uniref:hypothetical protein n=1 Tax=Streptomyces sp. NPDC093510 TaxID=3155199 RepID=UPI003429C104